MRKLTLWMLGAVVALGCTLAVPQTADAAIRLGADAIWVPMSYKDVDFEERDAAADPSHNMNTFAGSAHASMGIDLFSLGLKLNYFNNGIQFEEGSERYAQYDVNALARVGLPGTNLALFTEGGLTSNRSLDFGGFNVGAGAEYTAFSLPMMDINVGAMGQYVNVSEVELEFGGDEEKDLATVQEGRALIYVGADFGF
ncbi:MAG: hypothetical protein ACOCV2_01975 [Persicimonas sp.]